MHAKGGLPLLVAALAVWWPTLARSQPDPAFLQEDKPDVVLSPAILDQAQKLGNDPVQIYEFVRNGFEYQAYYGLMKGPEGTLRSRAGNEYDLAALLVSLLRAANVPARFVRGRIEMSDAQAAAWTGATSGQGACNYWRRTEPPSWFISNCGDPVDSPIGVTRGNGRVQRLHVWVEAEVVLARYRGIGLGGTGRAWVPLDPAFKQSDWPADPQILTQSPLPDGLQFDYVGPDGYYQRVDPRLPLEIFTDQVIDHLAATGSPLRFEDLLLRGSLRRVAPGILPTGLPYDVLDTPAAQRAASLVPLHEALSPAPQAGENGRSDYHYRWRWFGCTTFPCPGAGAAPIEGGDFTASLAGRRVTLSFPPIPASAPLVPPQGYECDPAVTTQPTVWIDGVPNPPEVVVRATQQPVCRSMILTLETLAPLGTLFGSASASYGIAAGSTYVFALDAHTASPQVVASAVEHLEGAGDGHPVAEDSTAPFVDLDRDGIKGPGERYLGQDFEAQEALIGGLLHLANVRYYDLYRSGEELARALHHRLPLRFPATGLVLGGIQPIHLFGAPAAVISNRLVIDVKALARGATTRTGALVTTIEPWMELASHQASAAEHTVWEELAAVEAVSTVKGFQVGFAQGQELLVLGSAAEASQEIGARCDGLVCDGLDRVAYCEIRRAFTLPSGGARDWDPHCSSTSSGVTLELRINACANFQHHSWTGFVFYRRSQHGSQLQELFGIEPTASETPVCSSSTGSSASLPAVAGPTLGGGYVANLNPVNPLKFDPIVPPPPSAFPSFIDLDRTTFGINSFATNLVTAGDPVSVVTGNNQHIEVDLRVAGRAGHDLTVVRSYNSRLEYDGPLGHGWIHTLDQHLIRNQGENPADSSDDVVFWRTEEGNEVRFDQTASGLVAEPGIYDGLAREPDGTYTLTLKHGGVMRFASDDPSGRANLLELRDRAGNRIQASYTAGRLSSVRDTANRELTFGYDGTGRLAEIRDWVGRRWLYEVDGNGDLVSFMDPEQVFREQASPGSGLRTRYSYDSGLADEALNHNLRCWIRPALGRPNPPDVPELCGEAGRGHSWMHFSYSPTDTVASHTDSLGRTTTFSFNFFRRRSYLTHPDGTSERYVFDRSGNVIRHETARGVVRRFEFEPGTRNKIKEWDGLGNLTEATYDGRGDLRSRTDRRGHTETWTYDEFGQPETHTDRRGNQKRWEYAPGPIPAKGSLLREFVTVDGVEVLVRSHGYDGFGNRSSTTAFTQPGELGSRTTQLFYGGLATALTRRIDGEGATTVFQVDALGRPFREERTRTVAGGSLETVVTQRCFDALDRVRRTVDPIGTVRRVAYDADGLVVARATATASEVAGVSPCGAIPAGRVDERRFYDAFGRMAESHDALGHVTRFEYDGRDRLTARVLPSGSREALAYDPDGNLASITDASGRTVRFEYDAEDRLSRTVDPLGRIARMEYDQEGNEIGRWEPLAPTSGNPEGGRRVFTALELDAVGQVLRFENAAGHEYRQAYDELGRLREVEGPLGLPESTLTRFEYNLLGQQTAKIDGGDGETRVSYDRVGRVARTIDALGRQATFTYDELGNLIRSVDAAGFQMEFSHDARGLLLRRSGPGVDDWYTYDEFGRRKTAANAVSSHRFAYDALDRPIEHFGTWMGTARIVYDEDGFATQLVYPSPPGNEFTHTPVATFQYDPAGRVTSIHDSDRFASPGQDRMWSWGFTWDGAGRLVDRLDPRGVRAATRYRPEGWVDEITYAAPGLADETVDYRVYDALGNPDRIDFPEGVTNPTFDARSRVRAAGYAIAGTEEEFAYDGDGNRVRSRRGSNDLRFVVDAADQLVEARRWSDDALREQFVHDGAGRRTAHADLGSNVATGYTYDGLGRLVAVADTSGYALALAYDPLGGRIRRTETLPGAAPETTLFLAGLVELRDVDAQGQAREVVRWLPGPGPGGVVAEVSAGGVWSLLGDAAENVVRMVQVTETAPGVFATTRATVRYAAFGDALASTGSVPTERRFAGLLTEGASGLVHMGARHYDPQRGAFLQPDPLGIEAVATYGYAANNPYRFVDPSGLAPQSIAGDFGFSVPVGGSGFGSFGGASSGSSFPRTDPAPAPLLDAQRPCGGAGCDFNPANSALAVSLPLGLAGGSAAVTAFQSSNLGVVGPLAAGVASVGVRNLAIRAQAGFLLQRNAALAATAAAASRASEFVRDPVNQFLVSDFGFNAIVGFEQGQAFRLSGSSVTRSVAGAIGFRTGQAVGLASTVVDALPALVQRFD